MRKALTQVAVAMMIAACLPAHPAKQASPVDALPAIGHAVGETSDAEGNFKVTVWRVPFLLSADFIPG
jgi:hypothetical protein